MKIPKNYKKQDLSLRAQAILFLVSGVFLIIFCIICMQSKNEKGFEVLVYNKGFSPIKESKVGNKEVFTKSVNYVVVYPKSVLDHIMLRSDPNSKEIFTPLMLLTYFTLLSIFCFSIKDSDNIFFTPTLIKGLTWFNYSIFGLMVLKFILMVGFIFYIKEMIGHELQYKNDSGIDGFFFLITFLIIALGIIVNFLKKGLQLQKDQDLTI